MALFLKRLVLATGLAFGIFVIVTAVLWAAGYFVHFTTVGDEPRIVLTMGAAPWGMILFLVIAAAVWFSVKLLPRKRDHEARPGRRAA